VSRRDRYLYRLSHVPFMGIVGLNNAFIGNLDADLHHHVPNTRGRRYSVSESVEASILPTIGFAVVAPTCRWEHTILFRSLTIRCRASCPQDNFRGSNCHRLIRPKTEALRAVKMDWLTTYRIKLVDRSFIRHDVTAIHDPGFDLLAHNPILRVPPASRRRQ
jgi:hypothetical protein